MDVWKRHVESNWNAFETYKVRILIKDLVGGKPATPEMIQKWVDATNKDKSEEERKRIKDAHVDTLPDVADEKAEKQSCVFSRVDGELAIEGRQLKAMIKESGNIIRTITPGSKEGELVPWAALRSKVADQCFVMERYIKLGKTEPDERLERPIHVMTAQGPRTSIKRVEIVRNVEIEFTLKRRKGRDKSSVPEKVLMAVLDYAQTVGLGADRSQGYGTFRVLGVEKIEDVKAV